MEKSTRNDRKWKCKVLKTDPIEKAKEIQEVQEKQALLKSKELEVCRKTAHSRGLSAARQMSLEQMKKSESSRHVQEARHQALVSEKERARKVALRTPPPIELPPLVYEDKSADFYDVKYMGTWRNSSEIFQVAKPQQFLEGTASLQAVLLREEKENIEKIHQEEIGKRNQITSQRFQKAMNKQKTLQDYDLVLTDLEIAHQKDISRKKNALVLRNASKWDAVKDDIQPGYLDQKEKLQKEIETLLYESTATKRPQAAKSNQKMGHQNLLHSTISKNYQAELGTHKHGSYVKSKGLIEQMRSERQRCMKKWRPESWETETLNIISDCPSNENKYSEEPQDILNQGLFEFAICDENVDGEILENQEIILPQRDLNALITDGRNVKVFNQCDETSLKMDATTQTTSDYSPLTSSSTSTKEESISSASRITDNVPTSSNLKLGSTVTVPVISSPATSLSELIQKAALKTLSSRPVSSTVGIKLEPAKPKLFGNLFETQLAKGSVGVKCEKQDRINSSPRMFPDLTPRERSSTSIGKSVAASKTSPNVYPKTSACVEKETALTPLPPTSTPSENIGVSHKALSSEPAQCVIPEPPEPVNKLVPRETPETKPVKQYTADKSVSKDMSAQKLTLLSNNKSEDNSHKSYFCKPRLFDSITETLVAVPLVDEDAHDQVQLQAKDPSQDQIPMEVVSLVNVSQNTLNQCQNISGQSLETDSFEETGTGREVSLPGYLRHSLASELHQNNMAVNDQNIYRLLESIVAFESVENYIRPPPPVSFRGVVQGMEDVYPHELSTILEVDSPQNSFLKSRSQQEVVRTSFSTPQDSMSHFESQESVLLTSPVTIPDILCKVSTPSARESVMGPDLLSPPMSIPSTCSTISNCLKKSSCSTSTTSSKLSEAFRSVNIKTHSTPIKDKESQQNSLESNIMDQSVTLIEGFTLDESEEAAVQSLTPTKSANRHAWKENQSPQSTDQLRLFQSFRRLKASPKKSEFSSSRVGPLYNSGNVSPLRAVQQSASSNQQQTVNSTVSDSLLSFMQHEQSIENSSVINSSFFN